MVGNLATLNNYLNNTLHISNQVMHDVLNEQGLDSIDSFKPLTDQDMKDLGNTCRKLGGMIANPNAVVANTDTFLSMS